MITEILKRLQRFYRYKTISGIYFLIAVIRSFPQYNALKHKINKEPIWLQLLIKNPCNKVGKASIKGRIVNPALFSQGRGQKGKGGVKVVISYPPLRGSSGYPTLGQNRQFQEFSKRTAIYPIVPAQAATLLKEAGHEVIWNDCIAEGLSYQQFLDFIKEEKPGLVAFETKTPVVKQHWKIIDEIKKFVPRVVLFGDHVTALPEESFQNSQVDFILTGGDYDFLLLNLCNYLELHIQNLEPGIWYRDNGQIKNTGSFQLNHDLDSLPLIDRDLTKWKLYAYDNGNYKRTPGTYIMSGRDCWYHQCAFCSWRALYPQFRLRKPENVLNEIGMLIENYKIREIMDDTGTFPVGNWLRDFCRGMIKDGFNKKVYFDCNMRFGALTAEDFALMKKANFRLLLFGLESANQTTLDRIKKNITVSRIIQDCKLATRAGLFPHITIMFGYPWEDYQDALKTLNLGKWLLRNGLAYTMQATMFIPYPGTQIFDDCLKSDCLLTLDWDCYNMKKQIIRTPIPEGKINELIQSMYKVSFAPSFVLRKMFSLRDRYDVKYFLRAVSKVIGHIADFKKCPNLSVK